MKRLTFIICALMLLIGAQAAETAQPKTYDVTIQTYDTMYFAEDNDVYISMHSEDYMVHIRLDIFVEEGQQFFTSGKTYTWDDMYQKFCSAYISEDFREYPFSDASFTWTLDGQGLEHIAGTATDTLGNTYIFRYDEQPFIPTGDTIELTFRESLKMEHVASDDRWYFFGTEDPYYILLNIINDAASPAGHYTPDNIVMDFSYIDKSQSGGDYQLLTFMNATIDITKAADDTLRLEATITAEDGNVYLFHMFYAAPKPLHKVTITADNLYINTDYLYGLVGAFRVEASDDTHSVYFAFSPMSDDFNLYDTYTISDYTANIGGVYAITEPETVYDVFDGTVTVTMTENGPVVSGTILCYNNTEYTLNLTYAVPDKTREAEMNIDGMVLKTSMGAWRLEGYNPDSTQYIALVFNAFGIAGDYTYVDMSRDHSYIVTDIVWDASGSAVSYNYFDLRDADLTVEFDAQDNIVTVTGTVLVQNWDDVPLFTVRLTNKPSQQEAITAVPAAPSATKHLENGMLVIEQNGHKYNIIGKSIQ